MRKNEKVQDEERQRIRLRQFDQELVSYTGKVVWFLTGGFSFLMLLLICIPVQRLTEFKSFLVLYMMFSIWIEDFFLQPYIHMADAMMPRKGWGRTYERLKYLPISKKQYIRVRLEYLFCYLWKLSAAGLILQCVFSWMLDKQLTIWNVVYVIWMLLVMPMFWGWLELIVEDA